MRLTVRRCAEFAGYSGQAGFWSGGFVSTRRRLQCLIGRHLVLLHCWLAGRVCQHMLPVSRANTDCLWFLSKSRATRVPKLRHVSSITLRCPVWFVHRALICGNARTFVALPAAKGSRDWRMVARHRHCIPAVQALLSCRFWQSRFEAPGAL